MPILFELVRSRAKAREYIALFMVPLGFAAYCMVNCSVSGDAFKFMEYQSIHWHQQLGWFFGTAAYQTENAVSAAAKSPALFWGDDGCDMASERAALSCGDDLTSGGNVGAYGKCAHRARTCPAERAPVFRIFHIFPAPMAGVVKK